ncbi:MAG: ABC transporter substrate-binding protein, partial [Rhizobiales bacterium]|nr:ABC transporter substrate-binding protein [Hyphomicrobiales bacterium]
MGAAAATPLVGLPAYAKTKVKVGALRFTSHSASFVAFERGYFADEGLDVEFKFFQAAQPMA